MRKYTKLPQNAPLEQKLNSYTLNGDCWEYNGCSDSSGYGTIMVEGKLQRVHRLSWEFHNHKKIPKGMVIDHICFNRKCINPAHLRLATIKDNCSRHNVQLKTRCEKHGCKRKIQWHWSSQQNKLIRRSVCPQCKKEDTRRYRERLRTVTQTVRDGSAKAI